MNTSLFVGLIREAGACVEFWEGITRITDRDGITIAEVSEKSHGRYFIDTNMIPISAAIDIAEAVTAYMATPINER